MPNFKLKPEFQVYFRFIFSGDGACQHCRPDFSYPFIVDFKPKSRYVYMMHDDAFNLRY